MGSADWDLNDHLRRAFQRQAKMIKDLLNNYDETFELAKQLGIKLDKKYEYIYKIWQ